MRSLGPLEFSGGAVELTSNPAAIADAPRLVLPGVGAFGSCMDGLRNNHLVEAIAGRRMARSIINQIVWRLRQDPKGREYFLSSMIRLQFRRWLDYRREMRLGANLDSLEGKRFVFFPLQTGPEIRLQVLSSEFFFQLRRSWLCRAICRPTRFQKIRSPNCGGRSVFFDRRPAKNFSPVRTHRNVISL